jgi:hypothetical protein
MNSNPPSAALDYVAKHFRRLKPNELVSHGDFVQDGHSGFEPWEGPGGFRADSFVKAIYRKLPQRSTSVIKLQ